MFPTLLLLLLLEKTSLYPVLNFTAVLLLLDLFTKEELIILSVGFTLFTKFIFLCLKCIFLLIEGVLTLLLIVLDK